MSKPIPFGQLKPHSLFRIFAEKKDYYDKCEKRHGFVRSHDRTIYKKYGNSHASSRDGHTIILGLSDLVTEFVPNRSK